MIAKCIQLDMACATLCYAAARLMSMGSEQLPRMHPCLHSLRGSLPEMAAWPF